ncbi:MAG: CBS domain-containing protein [Deltaproteobacteria bacterium]|nr:CBS domain-containing protein [Deltaproteobacteria bacterium]
MSPDPVTLAPDDSVAMARREMELATIRHLPVVEDDNLVGLITQRDVLAHRGGEEVPVSELMRTDVVTVSPGTAAHEAAYMILRHSIGSVPVVDDDGKLVGIVTDTDFVRVAYTLLGGRVDPDELAAEEREADNL